MDRHIKDVLGAFVKQGGYENDINARKLSQHWAAVMGDTIVQHTRSVEYKSGIVTMRFDSAPLRHEMYTLRDRIKAIFAEGCPDIRISEVIVR